MKKKLFVCSDIHGHASILRDSLKEAGFEKGNKKHLLICLGDYFERGDESAEVYEYLKSLGDQAICLYGNHEKFLQDFLEGPTTMFNYIYNGFDKTLDSFLGRTAAYPTYLLLHKAEGNDLWYPFTKEAKDEINVTYPNLLKWVKERPYYFETKKYIFTHGMIDGECEDWHKPNIPWKECIWAKPRDFLNDIKNTDKKVVVGHINTGLIREMFYNGDGKDNSIFERPDGKVIGLDTCTILTKKINILVIEDELI